ncbi:hypothetical protein Tco_0113709, partial [Tanacetum coccineum]
QFGYGYLEEIVVRRTDQKLYTFKEGNFQRLHLNDIEDIVLLHVQNKLFNLEGDQIVDLIKLNITRPQKDYPSISVKELFTPSYDPTGIIYENKKKRKRLMCADELYKFCDGILRSVRKTLHERVQNFQLGYNKDIPRRI